MFLKVQIVPTLHLQAMREDSCDSLTLLSQCESSQCLNEWTWLYAVQFDFQKLATDLLQLTTPCPRAKTLPLSSRRVLTGRCLALPLFASLPELCCSAIETLLTGKLPTQDRDSKAEVPVYKRNQHLVLLFMKSASNHDYTN